MMFCVHLEGSEIRYDDVQTVYVLYMEAYRDTVPLPTEVTISNAVKHSFIWYCSKQEICCLTEAAV
jgi:hypothetical protein